MEEVTTAQRTQRKSTDYKPFGQASPTIIKPDSYINEKLLPAIMNNLQSEGLKNKGVGKISRRVWILGFVSLLTDVSSKMIDSILPLFLVSTLQANLLTVGYIEGIAESTASRLKIFSGALSDRITDSQQSNQEKPNQTNLTTNPFF